MSDKITFFPVGNGDMTLITSENGINILIDCNIREKAKDEDDEAFDCYQYLMENLPEDNDIKYLDAFILTHHDVDHCRGVETYFNLCDPDKAKEDKILIKELIVAPRLLVDTDISNDSAKKLRKEADRRKKLFDNDEDEFDKDGNRLQIIGYSTDLSKYSDITTVAGQALKTINGNSIDGYEMFVLGPVKKDNDDEDAKINDTCIVLKITFYKGKREVIMIAGGDETCDNWVDIVNKNPKLIFDIFIAPHHCSWHSISNEDSSTGKANQTITDFLEKSKQKAFVIASSKPIKRNSDNPPSYRAKNEYIKHLLNNDQFICLGEYPSEKETKPLILNASKQGISLDEPGSLQKASAFTSGIIYTPKTYG